MKNIFKIFKEKTDSELIQNAINASLLAKHNAERNKTELTVKIIKKILGNNYSNSIEIIDNKVFLYGFEIFIYKKTYGGFFNLVYGYYDFRIVGYGLPIRNIRDFGDALQWKYGKNNEIF